LIYFQHFPFLSFCKKNADTIRNVILILVFVNLLLGLTSKAQFVGEQSLKERHWVDSVYNALTLDQRIGQVFMLRVNSDADSVEIKRIAELVKLHDIGGLCFFKGGPVRQVFLTNYFQGLAPTPLYISMDAEWGLGMRLDSTISFPRQMTLGAVQDESLISECGSAIADQLNRVGVEISFAPVADINSNAANPVINIRSFGERKEDVARKSILYMNSLQAKGILTVAKHFPGHGDTDTDSHHALPFIGHSLATIDSLDLFPFRELLHAGVDGMMVAHLYVPALDSTRDLPSSLSPMVIDSFLRSKMHFEGLVFTDALDMGGVVNHDKPGKLELRALKAGNDVLLLPGSIELALANVRQAIDSGEYLQQQLETHCKRILAYKYRSGLWQQKPINLSNVYSDLHSPKAEKLNLEIFSKAVTVLRNEDNLLPLKNLDGMKIADLTIGYNDLRLYQHRMDDYARIDHFTLPRHAEKKEIEWTMSKLKSYDLVIIGINNTTPIPTKNFGISDETVLLVDSLLASKTCVLNLFALPYSVGLFKNADKAKALLVAYQDNEAVYDASVQILFGSMQGCGRLPVGANKTYPVYSGLKTETLERLRYNPYNESKIGDKDLAAIDSIVNSGIMKMAYPGCQVLIAHNGNVMYRKAFGDSDYVNSHKVKNDDLYDLASVTKVAATTLAVMKLYDQGFVDLDAPLSRTLKFLEKSNKQKITIREVMTHQAGLVPWIPFYQKTLKNGVWNTALYSDSSSERFPYRVANGLYLNKAYRQVMMDSIVKSPVSDKKEYKYSDLDFILMQLFVEKVTQQSLDTFVDEQFYKPLGLPRLTFNPWAKYPLERIMPTENDTVFRHRLIHGDVHDPAAAMMGGVAGHAGLFGTSNDMAVLMEMLLQHGTYAGRQYIKPSTVDLFTKRQFKGNRRGLGFDKPQLIPGEAGPACEEAPATSFGHTGFTGTYIWADPDNQLIIVFLSNRVNPDAEPNKLVQLGIRTQIQKTLYKALNKP